MLSVFSRFFTVSYLIAAGKSDPHGPSIGDWAGAVERTFLGRGRRQAYANVR